MGTRTFLQLWRIEAAYTNRTQPHDLAIDLSSVASYSLDKNDPRCLTLSFTQTSTAASPIQKNSTTEATRVSHTIGLHHVVLLLLLLLILIVDALTLTFEKEEQAAEWCALLKELSIC
jgi:hypothetical protein